MDSRSVALIRTTFKAVAAEEGGAERLSKSFYAILFTEYPAVRDYFPAAMDAQRDRLVKAIGYALDRLEEPEKLLPFLAQLGRDHRKYGVQRAHYTAVAESLKTAMRRFAGSEMWTDEVERAWTDGLALISETMIGAAEQESTPPVWTGTVVERREVLRNLAVIRLQLDQPMQYAAGQYLSVQIPSRPRMWRYMSPAVPANADGEIEFHIRSVLGGWVSPAMVGNTVVGDQWLLGSPLGGLGIPRNVKRKLLMIGCGTGIAPLRAQLMAMAQRRINPKVHLFVGGHHPCDLYDLETLSGLAVANKWLTVTPVTERDENPWWYYDSGESQRTWPGLEPRVTGQIGKIVAGYGAWADRDVQIVGSPSMVQTTKFRLMATGTRAMNIRHDPLF
ncbi:globin domain-containing protein [Nocardia cyriacigeorgica]|uniref:globin domain-containing protein n=1 Tax=Nocardia cyriacigeorgica TaxID=135487 RepID=UPI00055CF8A7|nr:globin domain-containing protein [Nocardia cyriacigeorgica]AVH21751.1 flavoprotein [Nocardia cyriacigeorgica]MBF6495065.1 flavoprotein [Nocardia cyriacigeorgica]TLF53497.1 flavoprotein [Nocardia cyriacigeorgica]